MASVADFRSVIFDYLSLLIDRRVFTLRFADLLSGIEKHGDQPAIELGNALYSHIVLGIAGAISEDDLRSRIAKEVQTIEVFPGFQAEESPVVKPSANSLFDHDPAREPQE